MAESRRALIIIANVAAAKPAPGAVNVGDVFLPTDTGNPEIMVDGAWRPFTLDTPVVIADDVDGGNMLKLAPTGDKSASTSAGGAMLIDNSGSNGAGLVIYSAQADPTGRLLVVRANSATFDAAAVHVDYLGTNHAVTIDHKGTGTASLGLSVSSTNESDTALGVTGEPDARGTVKITHNKPSGADGNSSLISLLANGAGTATQGIFFDTGSGVTTTGKLLNFRQNGDEVFVVDSAGRIKMNEQADPDAPAADEAVIYTRDNGSGKTQVCVRFATGAVQVLATEP